MKGEKSGVELQFNGGMQHVQKSSVFNQAPMGLQKDFG